MKKIGHFWVAKDEKGRPYLRGYLLLKHKKRARNRVYLAKGVQNQNKTKPTDPDYIIIDMTEGKPKFQPKRQSANKEAHQYGRTAQESQDTLQHQHPDKDTQQR